MKQYTYLIMSVLAAGLTALAGCKNNATGTTGNETAATELTPVKFNADSAYANVVAQCDFGARVPNSEAHRRCGDYLVARFKALGLDVEEQKATFTGWDKNELQGRNIIASYRPEADARIILAAHWDSRPWADKAFNANDRTKPVPGANDGGSGVGVLLEIARNLAAKQPSIGVDIAFFDAEDYGKYEGFEDNSDTWCLGSQYWAQNMIPYSAYNKPVYGILLDMVGGRGARFHYELFSQEYARLATVKVWSEAEKLGHSDYFIREKGAPITDDHVVLTRAGIPTTNIIESINSETQSFNPTWHTLDDTMANIDRASLKAVGETVLNVVYKEKP